MRRVAGTPLWLGHVGDARGVPGLHEAGIVAVVDLAGNEPPVPLPRELVSCRFPLIDGGGNPPWLLRAAVESVAGLLRAGVPTLVYCGSGLSRSPSVAGAAIAQVRGCSAAEGLAAVARSGAADVSPALWSEIQAGNRGAGCHSPSEPMSDMKASREEGRAMVAKGIKQDARRLVDHLPEDATWEDLMDAVYVRQAIEAGLADSHAGRTLNVKELRARLGLPS